MGKPLDSEEQAILNSVEQGEWQSVPSLELEIKRYRDYAVASRQSIVTPGASVRILRELQDMTPTDLATLTGLSVETITAIEQEQIPLTEAGSVVIAQALRCDPRVLLASV
ncbi:hypothetical protein GlitD10_0997 [Gloeomargarita lithophora Alchichica-D10]|uniref:HTH cro/C1-type domain-containing protein n=1 Tax=Gloeomargarita lithophora Alchichica-D10 TaxID=1188229 RepID=A0A1J0ABK9_9CYAN|nr:helix-turn-helix transcriptional regulator [Gloeomargarita lithophora]APB33315.1 hypothetical protein GlitD10_0997 [Gloeomargarita lithophora Alchichica-D10]